MAITKDKFASLLVYAVILVIETAFLHSIPGFGKLAALTFSLFGLMLIWFAESLGEINCFSRGVAIQTPPLMIGIMGWIFLVGYPVVFTALFTTASVWMH